MIVRTTINKIQTIAGQSWEVQYCPLLEDYPASAADFQLPIGMTEFERYEITGRPGSQQFSSGQIVTRILYAHIEAEEYGFIRSEVSRLIDQFTAVFTDKDTYGGVGMYILQKSPERITIEGGEPTFTFTGPTLEHPIGSDIWYHGFEMRCNVKGQWPFNC